MAWDSGPRVEWHMWGFWLTTAINDIILAKSLYNALFNLHAGWLRACDRSLRIRFDSIAREGKESVRR